MTAPLPFRPAFPSGTLADAGLNRLAVLDIDTLPPEIRQTLGQYITDLPAYQQLLLVGHGGRRLWECVQASDTTSAHPIDSYTVHTLQQHFSRHLPKLRFRFIYPGEQPLGLQQLGALAGWHQPSLLRIGIDREWGSWSAYRAVVLCDSDFAPTKRVDRDNPCDHCAEQACIQHCPAAAVSREALALERCLEARLAESSPCQYTCLARCACPVGKQHQYETAQMRHVYGASLHWIRQHRAPAD